MANEATGIPVVIAGLGEVGRAIARAVLASGDLRLVAAVDPAFAGRKLDELVGSPTGLTVAADPARALAAAEGGVLLLATSSRFAEVLPTIEQAVRAGLSVVSTCEELAYPWLSNEKAADALDALCEKNDVAVLGVGVNPGLALDRLPALLSQGTGEVRRLEARRVVDLSGRRESLWRKAGVGLSPEEFQRAVEADAIGHVGLAESATLAALGSGLDLDELEEEAEAVLAPADCAGPIPLRRGEVAGIRQVARGWQDGREVVRLEVVLAVGAEDPRDEITLEASPPLRLVVPGGFPGEAATAWSVVHAASAVPMLQGLVTVLDLPPGAVLSEARMLDKTLIGRESEATMVEVEKGSIRRLADALGDANPIHTDEAAARAAGFASLAGPLTFPAVLSQNERFRHALDLGTRSLLLGEESIEYGRPIVAGDRLTVKSKVADVQERAGTSGATDVLVLETEGRGPEGEFVFRTRETYILRRG